LILGLLAAGLLLTGCLSPSPGDEPAAAEPSVRLFQATSTPQRRELPPGWHQVLPYDGIRPIYNPEFSPSGDINLQDDELIMGVAWEGQAKAYPVTVLRIREMVNDEMAGVPYLVSW
jgi:hypothetical protein